MVWYYDAQWLDGDEIADVVVFNIVTEELILKLSNSELVHLRLGCKISDEQAKKIGHALANNEFIKELEIEKKCVSDLGMKEILTCLIGHNSLTKLSLCDPLSFSNGKILTELMEKNSDLKSLLVSSSRGCAEDMSSFAVVQNYFLTYLGISNSTMCKPIAKGLKTSNLQELSLSGFFIGQSLEQVMRNSHNLIKLSISFVSVWDNAALTIARLLEDTSALKELSFGNPSELGMIEIAKAIGKNSSLETLLLCGNKISNKAGIEIGKMLAENPSLTNFNLSETPFLDNALVGIMKGLEKNSILKTLDLNQNKISDEEGVAIGNALKSNSGLEFLQLIHNKMTDKAIIGIAEGLEENTTLKKLYFFDIRKIGPEGEDAIAKMVGRNSGLKDFCFEHQRLSEYGVINIAKALEKNTTLTSIGFGSDEFNFSDDMVTRIVTALEQNTTLTSFWLNADSMSNDAKRIFKELATNKRTLEIKGLPIDNCLFQERLEALDKSKIFLF